MNKTNSICIANFIVISFIPILFFISMLLGFIGLIPLDIPITTVFVIGFIMVIFLLFAKHNANYTICKMKYSYNNMENQLKSKLDENSLVLNNKRKSIFNVDLFLKDYYKNIRNNNFVSVAASVFPMLGILGTFMAIAISMPDFSVTDTKALDNEITILLSGVGSAFYASIYGILLSLIWTYFEKSGLSKIDRYIYGIKEKFNSNIWSENELKIYKYAQYELKDDKFVTALKETFDLDFIRFMNEQHLLNFKEVITVSSENFTQVSAKLEKTSKELTSILTNMDENKNALEVKNKIEKNLLKFIEATNTLEKNSKIFNAQLTSSLDRTFEKIDTEVADIVIKLADFATHVSLQSEEVQNSIQTYHRMIADKTKEQ